MQSTIKHPGSNIVYSSLPFYQHAENLLNLDGTYITGVHDPVTIIINGYDISPVTEDTFIIGYRVIIGTGSMNSNDTPPSFRLVTGLTQNSATYTSIGDSHKFSRNGNNIPDTSIFEQSIEIINTSDPEVIWINNNLNTIINGQNFGIRLYNSDTSVAINYITFQLLYGGTNLYIGNKNATEIYIGNKKATAAYIGNNQIL